MNKTLTALDQLKNRYREITIMNPFSVKGLYPKETPSLEFLPFEIPNPELLDLLPYTFNTITTWSEETSTQLISNERSPWHVLVDNCVVDYLIIPTSTIDITRITGPFQVISINILESLSFENNILTLSITYRKDNTIKRREVHIFEGLIERVYVCLSEGIIKTYLKVITNILSSLPNHTLSIRGYEIQYEQGIIHINNQPFPIPDLPLMGWLMYVMFS